MRSIPSVTARMTCQWLFVIVVLTGTTVMSTSSQQAWDSDCIPRSRRWVHFGSMSALQQDRRSQLVIPVSKSSLVSSRRAAKGVAEEDAPAANNKSKMWPPWPFSLLSQSSGSEDDGYRSSGALFWAFFRHRVRIGFRQMQNVGSQLWFHLPPATPPLILLACLPSRTSVTAAGTDLVGEVRSAAPALFSNSFARNLALASLGVAILSWSHAELHRKRRLVALPLPEQYRDFSRAILPHFLPEEVPEPDVEILRSMEKKVSESINNDKILYDDDDESSQWLSPKVKRHLQQLYNVAPKPQTFRATFREWVRMRRAKHLEEERVRRTAIVDELVALQALKKKAARRKKNYEPDSKGKVDPLGYALVTGASRGIGRAIAVELARWEIPLILVARDIDRLTALANDIESCYGVKCCILQADLSQPDAAERIHETTRNAGLKVDILVNNAGISATGLSVDMPTSEVQRIMQVNVMSVATLNHLYGRDMKENKRGRILVVSSVVGGVAAGPFVATYAATKAFERSLALSMARELEQYGVGVTCLLPGAVRDTSFRSRSNSNEALCWKLPFYARTAPSVASHGVRAMLAGDVEVVPGWQNRVFLKVFKPILPQRLTTLIVEMAWSPFELSFPKLRWNAGNPENAANTISRSTTGKTEIPHLWPGFTPKGPPRMLRLPEDTTGSLSEEKPMTLETDENDSPSRHPGKTTEDADVNSSNGDENIHFEGGSGASPNEAVESIAGNDANATLVQ